MWLITPDGFFSIVQKPGDAEHGTLTVRARVAGDLDVLRDKHLPSLGPTVAGYGSDYRYRATAPRTDVAAAMAKMIEDTSYENFKNEVAARQGNARASLYGEVWHSLHKLQTDPALCQEGIAAANAYGGVLVNSDGQVLLREVAGHYGGYAWTLAKGRPDPGETPTQTALREVAEETGYAAKIIGWLPSAYAGDTSTTAFFIMKPVGKPGPFGVETTAVEWLPFDKAIERILLLTTSAAGRARDVRVLEDAQEWLGVNGW